MLKWCGKLVLGVSVFLTIFISQNALANERGKLLFKENCASCHEFGRILTGPDLTDITLKRTHEWIISFIKNSEEIIKSGDKDAISIFNEYKQVKMPPATLSDAEIVMIINYIENYKPDTSTYRLNVTTSSSDLPLKNKFSFWPILTGFIVLIMLILLLYAYIFYASFSHAILIRKMLHPVLLLLLIVCGMIYFTAYTYKYINIRIQNSMIDNQKTKIEFSHRQHSGDYQINCIYCHLSASDNQYANIPQTAHCMKCHHYIRKGSNNDTIQLTELSRLAGERKNFQRKKGYRMPSQIHFDHGLHVKVAGLNCSSCHSDTNNVTIYYRQFSMKWCIDCHKTNKYNLKNNYYVALNLSKSSIHNDCILCHY